MKREKQFVHIYARNAPINSYKTPEEQPKDSGRDKWRMIGGKKKSQQSPDQITI